MRPTSKLSPSVEYRGEAIMLVALHSHLLSSVWLYGWRVKRLALVEVVRHYHLVDVDYLIIYNLGVRGRKWILNNSRMLQVLIRDRLSCWLWAITGWAVTCWFLSQPTKHRKRNSRVVCFTWTCRKETHASLPLTTNRPVALSPCMKYIWKTANFLTLAFAR